jgi:alkanesulfonate monooxygenase SsuD/methylene tetrahydromethanopterin reductase-like flavin-dependent oxidoreductase (luciferase family)
MEFREFGRELKFRPSLIEESMAIIRKAWAGERINFAGKRFNVGDLRVTPVPEHTPKLYLGGMAEPAIDRAARIADGFLSTGSIGHDVYVECLKKHGRAPEDGVIIAGSWAIVSDDPEREAKAVAPHALYQGNQYIEWGAFGPPDTTPRFPDGETALAQGLYQLWDADRAVTEITQLLKGCPQIRDLHFWARLPGETVAAGHRRVEYMAKHVLPRVRAAL